MTETSSYTREFDGTEVPVPGTYVLDKAHTVVGFVARHLVVTKVRGYFEEFEGAIVVAEDAAQSSVNVTIQVNSINTREEARDNHLRSADFFELETYPTITFSSTQVTFGKSSWKVDGDLTIKGVTKQVTLDVEFNGATADPWGGVRLGFSASTEIVREDYNVSFNAALETGGLVVGSKVVIEIEAEAVLQA